MLPAAQTGEMGILWPAFHRIDYFNGFIKNLAQIRKYVLGGVSDSLYMCYCKSPKIGKS
jgi:hypothetical protein